MLDSFQLVTDLAERKRLHCVACRRLTIHTAEARCSGSWSDPHAHDNGGQTHTIFKCGACDTVCYETVMWDSREMGYDEDNDPFPIETAVQYPAPVSAHFNFNTESTPAQLDGILGEMLYALAGSKMTLATIGLRLAVEFIVKDKKCKGRNLAQKIDDLHDLGHVDADQKHLLHRIREKGNAGAHEAVGMNADELVAGMSIIEGLLEKLYNGPARHAATIKRAQRLFKEGEAIAFEGDDER